MLESVAEVAEDWRLDDIKGLLGRCNFKSDMLDRKVSFLSGGEKVRQNHLPPSFCMDDSHTLLGFWDFDMNLDMVLDVISLQLIQFCARFYLGFPRCLATILCIL